MSIGLDGISTGLNTTALIQAITASKQVTIDSMEDRIAEYEEKQSEIATLISLIGDMEDALDAIADIGDFRSFSATYEENDAFSVSVDGDAVAGSYDIEVSALAKAELEISQGYASKTSDGDIGTGTLGITYAGTTTNVTITSDMNLSEVAAAIDDIDGVTAYVMDTGDASTPYRLVVQGDDAGSANTISIDTSGLSGGTAPSFTESVSASSASLTINGIAVTSDTNTVVDAVPGMTITLTDTTTSAINVTVDDDPEAIEEKIQTFVDAYNAVMTQFNTQSVYDSENDIRGAFVGEASVGRVILGLQTVLTSSFSGLGQDYDALSLIGIETDSDGKLSIDSDKLQELLIAEPDQVADLFTGTGGFIEAMLDRIDVYTNSTDGTLEVRSDSLEERISDMEDQVEVYEDRISRESERLRAQFSAMEAFVGSINSTGQYLTALLAQTFTTA